MIQPFARIGESFLDSSSIEAQVWYTQQIV